MSVVLQQQPVVMGTANGLTGSSIEEKTRRLLGWGSVEAHELSTNTSNTLIGYTPLPPNATAPVATVGGPTRKKSTGRSSRKGVTIHSSPYAAAVTQRSAATVSSTSSNNLTPPPSPAARLCSPSSVDCTSVSASVASTSASTSSSSYSRSIPNVSIISLPARRPSTTNDAYCSLPVSPVSPNTSNPYHVSLHQSTSQPVMHSPQPVVPAATDARVFERMRHLLPRMSTDQNAYRVLLQTVGDVVELEHQLQHLKDQTAQARERLCTKPETAEVPDDLAAVDLSDFKSMLSDENLPSLEGMLNGQYKAAAVQQHPQRHCSAPEPLTVDTSFA